MLMTPSLNASGSYVLKTPWATLDDVQYTCTGIATIVSMLEQGIDVKTLIYVANGLTETEYLRDLNAGVVILTLNSVNAPTIRVPNSYLAEYPNISLIPYSHVVLSVSLGAVADSVDLSFVKSVISGAVNDSFGITPDVKTHIAPTTGNITPLQHASIETARAAEIDNRTTDRAKYLASLETIATLREHIALLEEYIAPSDDEIYG